MTASLNTHNNQKLYQWKSEVKDSELDAQGIVNNAVYFSYMEHCRHKHLQSLGFNFFSLHQQGFDLVLKDCKLTFKHSLRNSDEFIVTSNISLPGKVTLIIEQEIFRYSDKAIVTHGQFRVTCINRKINKIMFPEDLLLALPKEGT